MPDDAIARARLEATTLRMLLAASGTNLTAEAGCMINRAFASFAAFASQQAPEGWRPIDTAPKDGRYIDVARYADDFGWIVGVSYWVKDLGGGWISKGTGPFGELGLAHPTHWQPRPTPPAMLDAAPSVTLGEVG